MSQTSYDREIFLADLLAEFEAANQSVKTKWDNFMSFLESNKTHWSDTQYFYFLKRVEEIEQAVLYMDKQIEGPIRGYIEDNIQNYKNIQK